MNSVSVSRISSANLQSPQMDFRENVQQPQLPPPKPQQDIFTTSVSKIKDSATAKYGLTAIAAAALVAVPTAYVASKKGAKKAAGKFTDKVNALTNSIEGLKEQLRIVSEKVVVNKEGEQLVLSKQAQLTTTLLGLASASAISTFVDEKKDDLLSLGYTEEEILQAEKGAVSIIGDNTAMKTATVALNKATRIEEIAHKGFATSLHVNGEISGLLERTKGIEGRIGNIEDRLNNQTAAAALSTQADATMAKYLKPYYGLNLLSVYRAGEKIDESRSEEALSAVRNAAPMRLTRSATDTNIAIQRYREKYPMLSSVWAISSEYAPIKTGGLGEVPVDIQDNFTKLGIDIPQFIPMYLKQNTSEFIQKAPGEYSYRYGNAEFKLDKMAEVVVPAYRNGKSTNEKVEFYVAELPITGCNTKKQLIFVKNDTYFNEGMYDCTLKAEEPEKFILMNKAIYQLAKYKVNQALSPKDKPWHNGVANLSVTNPVVFENLKAPGSMMLNDWQAGGMAGLCRYRAPMEWNYNELQKPTYEALRDMPLLSIGHNPVYHGSSSSVEGDEHFKARIAENMINTLFDHHAIAIAENAHSGVEKGAWLCNTVLLDRENQWNKQFNSLFMCVSLSDWFVPVSRNYAKEIISDPSKSGILNEYLKQRELVGMIPNTIGGIVNGTDKCKHSMAAKSQNNFVDGLVLKTYDENTPKADVMKLRKENKAEFYKKYIKPLLIDGNLKNAPEIVAPEVGDMKMSEEAFVEAPFIAFAHRLAGQKGTYIMKGAIFKLFDNWDSLPFKDKPKPYFFVGGPVSEACEVEHLKDLKNPNYGINVQDRVNHVLATKGNAPNPAIMSVAQFFCGPSIFEPCGLFQGESFAKGTPVITTSTGGLVDTVVDGKTGFMASEINEESYYQAMVRALDTYYNKPEEYEQMIMNCLNVDFSWAQKGKKGSIYEYTDKLGLKRDKLPDIAG